ncbi:MAG: hypothetical protein E7439_04320 [Ruminococcaceae bacterium]|nr:hypothetical protein [Oscillospiraceae bacterium]
MLIRCGECGRQVSDTAFTCPGCGRDVRYFGGSCSDCKYRYGRSGYPGYEDSDCYLGPKGYPCLGFEYDEYAELVRAHG